VFDSLRSIDIMRLEFLYFTMSLAGEDLEPTRANLLELDEQIELVEKGKNQLQQVQEQLINEFMNLLERWREESSDTSDKFEDAQNKLDMTRAMEGDVKVRSAAQATSEPVKLQSSIRNVAGVKVPEFTANSAQKELDERGYGILGSSARIDETASSYEEVVDMIVIIAELETAMMSILEEIEKIKRRVNAFEYRILPNLNEQKKNIEQSLMEKERQEVYSLKKIKDKKEEEEEEDDDYAM
jgi:V/A-type H+-transporting ATPase subunit D